VDSTVGRYRSLFRARN